MFTSCSYKHNARDKEILPLISGTIRSLHLMSERTLLSLIMLILNPLLLTSLQFCYPSGYTLQTEQIPPTIHPFVLTRVDSTRMYCVCLTFSEPMDISDLEGLLEENPTIRWVCFA